MTRVNRAPSIVFQPRRHRVYEAEDTFILSNTEETVPKSTYIEERKEKRGKMGRRDEQSNDEMETRTIDRSGA